MDSRLAITRRAAFSGAGAFGLGTYGIWSLGSGFGGDFSIPLVMSLPAFVLGLLLCIVATVAGAGAYGFGMALLAPGLGSLAAGLTGTGVPALAMGIPLIAAGVGVHAVSRHLPAYKGGPASRRVRAAWNGGLVGRVSATTDYWRDPDLAKVKSSGATGVATVLAATVTGHISDGRAKFTVDLRVTPTKEAATFQTRAEHVPLRGHTLQPGDRARVRYDPADPSRVVITRMLRGGTGALVGPGGIDPLLSEPAQGALTVRPEQSPEQTASPE